MVPLAPSWFAAIVCRIVDYVKTAVAGSGSPGANRGETGEESGLATRARRPDIDRSPQGLLKTVRDLLLVTLAAAILTIATRGLTAGIAQQAPAGDRASPEAELASIEDAVAGGQFEKAVPGLQAFVRDHPDSPRAHYDLGYVLFRTHQMGPSIKELSRSLQLNVDNAEAHKILGLDCSIVGRYDLAETELLAAERLKPGSAEIHYFLGRTYYTRGIYPLAKREYESALRLDPAYIKAYSNLGLTLEALDDSDSALKDYTTAAELDKRQSRHSEWPYVYLSAFYNRQGKSAEALDHARKALAINPNSDVAYFQMAKAYRSQGEWQKAADAAQLAIAINSQTSDFYYVLSLVLRRLGREKESEAAMAKVAELQKQSVERVRDLVDQPPQEPLAAPISRERP
jgi:tetratricopeptide (TPR) repeat protein